MEIINVSIGGRFREIYYWDSFWIVEGLIESQLFDIVNDTLQNFMDQLDQFGFIPNGGRIYCRTFLFNHKCCKDLHPILYQTWTDLNHLCSSRSVLCLYRELCVSCASCY
jgi:Trehalase